MYLSVALLSRKSAGAVGSRLRSRFPCVRTNLPRATSHRLIAGGIPSNRSASDDQLTAIQPNLPNFRTPCDHLTAIFLRLAPSTTCSSTKLVGIWPPTNQITPSTKPCMLAKSPSTACETPEIYATKLVSIWLPTNQTWQAQILCGSLLLRHLQLRV